VPRGRGVNVDTTFGEGPPPKFWEGKKSLKFGAISDNYRLRSRIYPEQIHISKIGKVVYQQQPIPRWTKKRWWTLVHKQKSYRRACRRTLNQLSAYCVSWRKFIRQWRCLERNLNHPKLPLQSDLRRLAASRLALPHISSFNCCTCTFGALNLFYMLHLQSTWSSAIAEKTIATPRKKQYKFDQLSYAFQGVKSLRYNSSSPTLPDDGYAPRKIFKKMMLKSRIFLHFCELKWSYIQYQQGTIRHYIITAYVYR